MVSLEFAVSVVPMVSLVFGVSVVSMGSLLWWILWSLYGVFVV